MPKLSLAEKRRRLAADLSRQIAAVVTALTFLAIALTTNDFSVTGLLIALVPAFILFVVVDTLFYRLFKRMFVPKTQPQFNFEDNPPVPKNQKAQQFEHDVAALIQQLSGNRTEVVGGSGDGGIDIKVFNGDNRLVGIVQCKLLAKGKSVFPSHIRDLNTVKHYNHVNTAYLVTTGQFSDDSRNLAKELGIRLIDGDELQRLRQQAIRRSAKR